jgi:hypothetical protein
MRTVSLKPPPSGNRGQIGENMADNRRSFRINDEDYEKLQHQASQLGLNASEYIRLIISLDASTEIIKRLKAAQE